MRRCTALATNERMLLRALTHSLTNSKWVTDRQCVGVNE